MDQPGEAQPDEASDLRLFLRELTLRHERAAAGLQTTLQGMQRTLQGMQTTLQGMQRTLDALLEESKKHNEALETARRELVSELGAQRSALFRILDRLPERGDPGTAGA